MLLVGRYFVPIASKAPNGWLRAFTKSGGASVPCRTRIWKSSSMDMERNQPFKRDIIYLTEILVSRWHDL